MGACCAKQDMGDQQGGGGGYYDDDGNWVDGSADKWYDEEGQEWDDADNVTAPPTRDDGHWKEAPKAQAQMKGMSPKGSRINMNYSGKATTWKGKKGKKGKQESMSAVKARGDHAFLTA